MSRLIPKKSVREIDPRSLEEPGLSPEQWKRYTHGADLFNRGAFWEAHEIWEGVWREREEDSRIFFQGIIQAAAAYHLVFSARRYTGALNNFSKALTKLALFPDTFLGLDVDAIRRRLGEAKDTLVVLGPEKISQFPRSLVPALDIRRQNPNRSAP